MTITLSGEVIQVSQIIATGTDGQHHYVEIGPGMSVELDELAYLTAGYYMPNRQIYHIPVDQQEWEEIQKVRQARVQLKSLGDLAGRTVKRAVYIDIHDMVGICCEDGSYLFIRSGYEYENQIMCVDDFDYGVEQDIFIQRAFGDITEEEFQRQRAELAKK